ARLPIVPGAVSPFDSAQSVRSTADSAIVRAWTLFIWLLAMTGSLELKARNATISEVSNDRMMSVIGSAMPSSESRRRVGEPFIDSSGERGLRRPPVGSPGVAAQARGLRLAGHFDFTARQPSDAGPST